MSEVTPIRRGLKIRPPKPKRRQMVQIKPRDRWLVEMCNQLDERGIRLVGRLILAFSTLNKLGDRARELAFRVELDRIDGLGHIPFDRRERMLNKLFDSVLIRGIDNTKGGSIHD